MVKTPVFDRGAHTPTESSPSITALRNTEGSEGADPACDQAEREFNGFAAIFATGLPLAIRAIPIDGPVGGPHTKH